MQKEKSFDQMPVYRTFSQLAKLFGKNKLNFGLSLFVYFIME